MLLVAAPSIAARQPIIPIRIIRLPILIDGVAPPGIFYQSTQLPDVNRRFREPA